MRITGWRLDERRETVEVSAEIGGYRIFYRVPKPFQVSLAGDPFLASALLPAMLKGETIEVDPGLAVSPRLLRNLAVVQEIHHRWNPDLKIVRIEARTAAGPALNTGAFSFFSGGVDSLYTFLKRRREITHAVYVHGFDFLRTRDEFLAAAERNGSFAAGFGKTLIPVETNHHAYDYHLGLSRLLTQGSTLASVALVLGFPRAYIPSSFSYSELVPLGSHPLLDPRYSTEAVEIVHDGAEAGRVEKLTAVAACEPALANLVVCIDEMNGNCGRCEKCLRTMVALASLGVRAPLFPELPPLKSIRRRYREEYPRLLSENLELALHAGRSDLARVLRSIERRTEWIRLSKDADRVLFGGALLRAFRRVRKPPKRAVNWIGVVPPQN